MMRLKCVSFPLREQGLLHQYRQLSDSFDFLLYTVQPELSSQICELTWGSKLGSKPCPPLRNFLKKNSQTKFNIQAHYGCFLRENILRNASFFLYHKKAFV